MPAAGPPAEALQKLGGARVLLATAPDSKSISVLVDGLAAAGKLVIVGAGAEPFTFTPMQLIMPRRTDSGMPSGTPWDSEDRLQFTALAGLRSDD
jgi:D-arabinose 1-dehydrogenase-like Zn-dependent alcohol dehydrogenase